MKPWGLLAHKATHLAALVLSALKRNDMKEKFFIDICKKIYIRS